ncbi:hypothetical protein [Paraburkholderia ribeironis]|nr:hypothetical protein [Paraburkholderia ribeironis]
MGRIDSDGHPENRMHEQRPGDGRAALAAEELAVSEAQLLHFFDE